MNSALIEAQYLPPIEFFSAIVDIEKILLEANEHFPKQTLRNRCYVNTAQGRKILTIPLAERRGKIFVKDVVVQEGNFWRNNHWRTIESAYRKAPYFEHYSVELKTILYSYRKFLFDLNVELLSFCLRHIGSKKNISATVTYEAEPEQNILDLRSVISDKKHFSDRMFYTPVKYYQIFGNDFVPNLSVIDLLFCEGPRATEIIRASGQFPNK